ncbi:MAG: serine--tRNA ligase [bacterium]
MIDLVKIRDDWKAVALNLGKRGVEKNDVRKLWERDREWRELNRQIEELKSERNKANDLVSGADEKEKEKIITAVRKVSKKIKDGEKKAKGLQGRRDELHKSLPNIVMSDVPDGGEENAEMIDESRMPVPDFLFEPKSYLQLLPDYIDLESAAEVSGSRFVYIKNKLARLELGLVSYVIDHLVDVGFEAVIPPVLIKEEAMAGMGYLDHEGDEIYKTQDDLYLVGTSEQSVGAMHMKDILGNPLPRRYAAYSTCFRREAGSHGKDMKGMLRVHQFNKVEMFSFCSPEQSEDEHEFLLEQQRYIMDSLYLPYRVIKLAAGDLGAPSAKTYDIETWIPSEKKYRETHSTSNTTDYQARRLNIRVKSDDLIKKAHMLNGTAVAVGRMIIALIENYQQEDGSINIPEVLHKYLPFSKIEKPARR